MHHCSPFKKKKFLFADLNLNLLRMIAGPNKCKEEEDDWSERKAAK